MTRKPRPQPGRAPSIATGPTTAPATGPTTGLASPAVEPDAVEEQAPVSGQDPAGAQWPGLREGSVRRPYITEGRLAHKLERRNLILSAAKTMFSQEPYGRVTFQRLADALGLSYGAIKYHFETKEALWRAVTGTAPPLDRPTARHHTEVETLLRQVLQAQATGDKDALETSLIAARNLVNRLPPRVA